MENPEYSTGSIVAIIFISLLFVVVVFLLLPIFIQSNVQTHQRVQFRDQDSIRSFDINATPNEVREILSRHQNTVYSPKNPVGIWSKSENSENNQEDSISESQESNDSVSDNSSSE